MTDRMMVWRTGLAWLCVMLVCPFVVLAQFGPFFNQESPADQPTELHHVRRLPRDPLMQASFVRGLQALENGDVVSGLETLQSLLDDSSDFFILDGLRISGSLLDEVNRGIDRHREEYERLFGSAARQLLQDAREARNSLAYEDVVRRYGMTQAGAEALRELARMNIDRGQPVTAARQLRQLARHPSVKDPGTLLKQSARLLVTTGLRSEAQDILEQEGLAPAVVREITDILAATESSPNFSAADAELLDWRLPFGGAHHIGRTAFAPTMFDDAWKAGLVHSEYDFFPSFDPDDEKLTQTLAAQVEELAQSVEERVRSVDNRVAMPAGRPLIVNGLVLIQGHGSVKAYDLATGTFRWNGAEIDPTFDHLNEQSYTPGEANDPVREEMRQLFFTVRGWRDLTSASMSTDGENVYAISNCQLVGSTNPQLLVQNNVRHPLLPQRSNLLTAYRLRAEGKKIWSIGTLDSGSQSLVPFGGEPRAEIFFMGAPLTVDGRLYVLGEERGQIQLFELDPSTGSILWSLGLLNPDQDLVLDESRRLSGLMPSYGGGLLICPTGEGVITAVDPVHRKVVWSHQYESHLLRRRNELLLRRGMRTQNQLVRQSMDELLNDRRWFDSKVMVAGQYVVFTPPDSDLLVCLNLADGKPVWPDSVARLQMLSAPTIFDDCLLLVGPGDITAIRLEDGSEVWPEPISIPRPSGRGVRMGDTFLQPLVTGEVAVVDLRAGRLLSRFPLSSGNVAGNLVAADGWLVSQTATEVVGFRSLHQIESEIARRLDESTNDPRALGLRGELQLQRGDVESALMNLRTAALQAQDPRARHVLSWALLDSLTHDFATFEKQAEEIESLLQTREQRLQFLRTFASGQHKAGKLQLALARYLDLLDVLPTEQPLRDQDSRWSATDGQWVLAQLNDLFESATDAVRLDLERTLTEWLSQTADDLLKLRVLRAHPGSWISAATVLDQLSTVQVGPETAHDREAILLTLQAAADPAVRLDATAELARLALMMKQAGTADRLLHELESLERSTVSTNGKSGADVATAIRADEQFRETLAGVIRWSPKIQRSEEKITLNRPLSSQLPVLGPVSAQLEGWTFFIDQMGANLEVVDPDGVRRQRISTGLQGGRPTTGPVLGRHVSLHGHRAAVVLADRVLLLDLLSDNEQVGVILNQPLMTEQDNPYGNRAFIVPGQRPRPGMRTFVAKTPANTPAGNVGPLTASILCFGLGEDLIAVDPVTGRELWKRRDLTPGSEIFGDERYVLIKPPDEQTFTVYRAADGRKLEARPLPVGAIPNCIERHGADWGRLIPVTRQSASEFEWKLVDPLDGQARWTWTGPAATRWTAVSGQDVAFLTSQGKLTVCRGLTGEPLLEATVPFTDLPATFSLLSFPTQWILTASSESMENFSVSVQSLINRPANGHVLAIDRETATVQWQHPVQEQLLLTAYPRNWPVLIFGNGRGNAMNGLILNRYTGEAIYGERTSNDGTGVSWQGQMEPPRIQIRFAREAIELKPMAATEELPPGETQPPSPPTPLTPAKLPEQPAETPEPKMP